MSTPANAIASPPTTPAPAPNLGALEGAGVAFGGAFAGGLAEGLTVTQSAIIGAVAFFAALGYAKAQGYL